MGFDRKVLKIIYSTRPSIDSCKEDRWSSRVEGNEIGRDHQIGELDNSDDGLKREQEERKKSDHRHKRS